MGKLLQEMPDQLLGSIVLVLFVAFCFAAGKVLATFKNARFTKAWSPLRPLIGGKVVTDGGGAATSWLTGTYQGRRVQASMTPDRNRYPDETGVRYNHFEVELLDVPGEQDWRIVYEARLLDSAKWHVDAEDPSLRQRLEACGVIPLLEGLGSPEVRYSRSQARLSLSEDAGPRWIPTPEHFEAEITSLLRLAQLNGEVNPPASGGSPAVRRR